MPTPTDTTLRLTASVELEAAAGDKPARVSIVAYGGEVMNVPGWGPVVIDLAGLQTRATVTLLADHDNRIGSVVGQGAARVEGGKLYVAGQLTKTAAAVEVRDLLRDGVKLQASVGVEPSETRKLRAGEKINVNGRALTIPAGGATLIARGLLREVTITPLGADPTTSVAIAAHSQRGNTMTTATPPTEQDIRASERERISKIEATCRGSWTAAQQQRIDALKAQAISGDIGVEVLQGALLEELRASRPLPNVNTTRSGPADADILEASLAMSCGISAKFAAEHFDQATMNEALSARYRGAGLHTLIRAANRAAGGNSEAVNDSTIRAALDAGRVLSGHQVMASGGFSTFSVTDILSNTANKMLLAAYMAVPSVWRKFCAIGNNRDFKVATRYRLISDGTFEQVGPGGEVKHGTLSDQSFTSQVNTYGKLLCLTRTDLKNDDLGAFASGPQILGRDAGVKLERAVFEALLANANNFFHGDNNNLSTTTPLSIDGLTAAELLFRNQVDPSGQPIMVNPSVLLVPNALIVLANQLVRSTNINEQAVADSATPVQVPNNNPHAGRFTVAASPWLSSSALSGSSAEDWYLFADPAEGVAAFMVAFLDGQQSPTIETADADFSTLGVQMRAVFDFGVDQLDPRAGVKADAS